MEFYEIIYFWEPYESSIAWYIVVLCYQIQHSEHKWYYVSFYVYAKHILHISTTNFVKQPIFNK